MSQRNRAKGTSDAEAPHKAENNNTKYSKMIINNSSWEDGTSIEDFFRSILFESREDRIKEAIDTAKKLGVDKVCELKLLTESDLKEHFTLSVTRRIQAALQPTASVPTQFEKAILERLDKLILAKATISFSKISASDWDNDFLYLHLKRQEVRFKQLPFDVDKDIKGFPWTEAEDKPMKHCLEWLCKWIQLPDVLQYVDVHTFTKRYMLQIGEHTYKGRTDVIIAPTYASEAYQSTIAVIELKQPQTLLDNKDQCIAQVEAELIAASNVSSFPVLAVLTDLNDFWFFSWFPEKGKIARCTCKPSREGVAILNQFVRTVEIPEDLSQDVPKKFSFPACIAYKTPPLYSSRASVQEK